MAGNTDVVWAIDDLRRRTCAPDYCSESPWRRRFQQSYMKCDNCGIDASGVKVCDSCASEVCSTCMAEDEDCCLGCLETFPVASLSDVSDGSRVHWPVPFERMICDPEPTDKYESSKHTPLVNQLPTPFAVSPHTPPQMQQIAGNANSRTSPPLYQSTSRLAMETAHCDHDVSGKASTTMMFCNIPCRASREEVVQVIDSAGFADMYDFIYLPGLGGCKSSNIGYAFVDLKSPQFAQDFARVMEGFQFPGRKSAKKCTVKRANKQHFNKQNPKGGES